jgi:hypothetical protein
MARCVRLVGFPWAAAETAGVTLGLDQAHSWRWCMRDQTEGARPSADFALMQSPHMNMR